MEEDLRPRLKPELPGAKERRDLRGFGIGLGALLLLFAWRSRGRDAAPPLAACAALSWTLAAGFPAAFGPVYRVWMPVVGVLARINLWLICGVLYYLIVTPYALLLRAFGVRLLKLDLGEKDRYWQEKPPRDPVTSSRRQF